MAHLPGVPNILRIMLEQLSSKNNVQGWNVYENKSGFVCLNIRFDVEGGSASRDIHTDLLRTQYRKVSPKQQLRNLKRGQAHKQTVVTRSMTDRSGEIEQARTSENEVLSPSFISVDVCTAPLESSPSPPCVASPDYESSDFQLDNFLEPRSATVIYSSPTLLQMPQLENLPVLSVDISTQVEASNTSILTQAGSGLSNIECSSQTNSVSERSISVQCGVRCKSKDTQTKSTKTTDFCAHFGPNLTSQMDLAVQATVLCASNAEQVGTGFYQLESSSSQTQFLCPGLEDDPSYDQFWLNRPCSNYACRYRGPNARLIKGNLWICPLCNIILCNKCKEETVHDEFCGERLRYHKYIH